MAISLKDPETDRLAREVAALTGETLTEAVRLLSAANAIETSFVFESRKGEAGRTDLARFLEVAGVEIVAVTADQAELASEAFRRYGKGRHPANLNFGDVFAYAPAKTTGEPLLFKGGDFSRTDLPSVVQND